MFRVWTWHHSKRGNLNEIVKYGKFKFATGTPYCGRRLLKYIILSWENWVIGISFVAMALCNTPRIKGGQDWAWWVLKWPWFFWFQYQTLQILMAFVFCVPLLYPTTRKFWLTTTDNTLLVCPSRDLKITHLFPLSRLFCLLKWCTQCSPTAQACTHTSWLVLKC